MKLYILIAVCFALTSSYYSQDAKRVEFPGEQSLIKFGIDICRTIAQSDPGKNVITAPPSIYGALLLALLASAGDTQNELAKALYLESYLSKNDLVSAYKDLGQLLSKTKNSGNETKIFLGEGIFINDKVKLSDKYKQEATDYFNSEIQSVNFADEKKASEIVNEWVSKNTNGQITKLLDKPIDSQTIALLSSVLHFEAEWETKFPVDSNSKGKFYNGDKNETEVHFLNNRVTISYHDTDQYTAIKIPYKNEEAYFLIILPHENVPISDLIRTLSPEAYIAELQYTSERYVDLTIPKLELKFSKDLKEILGTFGIIKAFKAGDANFNHLAPNIYIGSVFHKTQMHLNESGTVASALTTIEFVTYSAPPRVIVNRPFIFSVVEAKTQVSLFIGVVYNPQES